MANISLETQGIKGGKTNKTTPLGSIKSFLRHESDFIFIDDFEGSILVNGQITIA